MARLRRRILPCLGSVIMNHTLLGTGVTLAKEKESPQPRRKLTNHTGYEDDHDHDHYDRMSGREHRRRKHRRKKSDRSPSSSSSDEEESLFPDAIGYEFGLDKLGVCEYMYTKERNDYVARIRNQNGYEKKGNKNNVRYKMQPMTTVTVKGLDGSDRVKRIRDPECLQDPSLLRCLRFSKVKFPPGFVPGASTDEWFPLDANDYPLQPFLSEVLEQSLCPSVIDPQDAEHNLNLDALAEAMGGPPTMPACGDNLFWDDLEEVVDVAIERKRDPHQSACKFMGLPQLWRGFTMTQAAEAVHDEYPGLHQSKFIESLLMAKSIRVDPDIIPQRSKRTYLRGPVMLAELNTWSVKTVGSHSFQSKWHFGRPRPEEVAFRVLQMIEDGTHETCVPQRITRKIMDLQMSTATNQPTDFTAYPEGSPDHPSWPAMHSAASSLSLWLPVVCQLTDEQIAEAKRTDYAVAHARTIAGVHYTTDNTHGLNLGQEVVAKMLPLYLNSVYGSDIARVEAKIKQYRFDWRKYDTEAGKCS